MTYIIFAQWFGVVSVILSLGILFNLNDAQAMAQKMANNESGYIMGAVLPLVFGTLALMSHPIFSMGWSVVVTLSGVFLLLIGAFRALFATHWKRLIRRHLDKVPALFALFGLMFGLLMLYVGFFSQLLEYQHLL
jgi:hypothetical protein